MTIRPSNRKAHLVFFGTEPLAEAVLVKLEDAHFMPSLVIAGPDIPDRRTKVPIAPIEKHWAKERDIEVLQPAKIDAAFINDLQERHATHPYDAFLVASYGKILPQALLDIPEHGTINMHPSLLPRLRGPSPIRSAILEDERETGVSVMLLDAQMDHGPILAQKSVPMPEWPMRGSAMDELLAREGASLLAETVPHWLSGEITPREQDHSRATYCKLFSKDDGYIRLNKTPYQNLLKIRAYEGWPGTYTFFERAGKRIRVSIIDAHMENGKLVIDTVRPEGKRDMPFQDFALSGATPVL